MSLLDSLGGGQNAGGVMGMIGSLITQAGGVQGLINSLQQGGLGNAVQSWVANGANQAINGGQLQQALAGTPLGSHVQEMAQRMGVDPSQVLGQLAQHLPTAIDHMTPNGQMPDAGAGLGALQGLAAKLGL